MPNVVRFALSTAKTLYVPGAGTFVEGILDVDANNLRLLTKTRYLVQPYRAVELGTVDAATPKPTLPAVPGPPAPDPYPQYLTPAEAVALPELRAALGSRAVQALRTLRGSDDIRRRVTTTLSPLVPTITQGTSEFWQSGITGGVTIPWTDPRIRYNLNRVVDSASIGVAGTSYACSANTPRSLAWPFPGGNPFRAEFVYRGQVFAWGTRYNNAKWRLLIDDQPVTAGMNAFTTINSTERQVRIDLGSRAERRIAIEGETDFYFRGLYVEPTGVVSPSPFPLGPKVAWMTDSFGQGGGLSSGIGAYTVNGSRLCGWGDIDRTECVGSTGFVNLPAPNTSGFQTYPNRVASMVAGRPDIVVIQGSRNDTASAGTNAIRDAAISVFDDVREALPDAWIIATGPLYIETPPAAAATNQSEIRAAYNTVFGTPGDVNVDKRVAFIDTLSPALAGGTGRMGATTGDGPADFLRFTDGTHPGPEGHLFLETWLSGQVARICRTARSQIAA